MWNITKFRSCVCHALPSLVCLWLFRSRAGNATQPQLSLSYSANTDRLMHYSLNGKSQAPANSWAAHFPPSPGSPWAISNRTHVKLSTTKFNLIPASVTILVQNPNRERKALVPKAMLSNNMGKLSWYDQPSSCNKKSGILWNWGCLNLPPWTGSGMFLLLNLMVFPWSKTFTCGGRGTTNHKN